MSKPPPSVVTVYSADAPLAVNEKIASPSRATSASTAAPSASGCAAAARSVRRGTRLRIAGSIDCAKVKVTLANEVADATSIHWHGIRLPNAMDGVPHLTQKPVGRGERFVYEFAANDSGTFWYHPHWQSHEQVERGLYGALIVEEDAPPEVDRDVVWMLDDWRLTAEARIAGDFANLFDVSHAGRLGNRVTVNGKAGADFPVRRGERIRLRLVNAANARIFGLRF
ncbi:MAG: multicopper oxidase domain-containing protein, partial [Candidatus Sumerlaeia bacterium]|nr:multicopper oxidase domain-containing protein [Candidatus Sumerlaeia bacterium]